MSLKKFKEDNGLKGIVIDLRGNGGEDWWKARWILWDVFIKINAGSLQDLDRAVLIGSRSFGKDWCRHLCSFLTGGLLKVTVAKYYLPSEG